MLISCPKCHSIYEIPDDLIGKTGRNFRCQACGNVWHAMRSDALGYEEEAEDKPFIEPIPVSTPPERPFPSEKEEFIVPADSQPGRKTPSSADLLAEAGALPPEKTVAPKDLELPKKFMTSAEVLAEAQRQAEIKEEPAAPELSAPPPEKQEPEENPHEITLLSDYGTAFTISMDPPAKEKEEKITPASPATERREPHLFAAPEEKAPAENMLRADSDKRLTPPAPFKGYRKTYLLLFVLFLAAAALFLRREVVTVYPAAEAWYGKIGLSGLDNAQYLAFEQISVAEKVENGKNILAVTAVIANRSVYTTDVPPVTVNNGKEKYAPERPRLKGGEKTRAVFTLPAPAKNAPLSLNFTFAEP